MIIMQIILYLKSDEHRRNMSNKQGKELKWFIGLRGAFTLNQSPWASPLKNVCKYVWIKTKILILNVYTKINTWVTIAFLCSSP